MFSEHSIEIGWREILGWQLCLGIKDDGSQSLRVEKLFHLLHEAVFSSIQQTPDSVSVVFYIFLYLIRQLAVV